MTADTYDASDMDDTPDAVPIADTDDVAGEDDQSGQYQFSGQVQVDDDEQPFMLNYTVKTGGCRADQTGTSTWTIDLVACISIDYTLNAQFPVRYDVVMANQPMLTALYECDGCENSESNGPPTCIDGACARRLEQGLNNEGWNGTVPLVEGGTTWTNDIAQVSSAFNVTDLTEAPKVYLAAWDTKRNEDPSDGEFQNIQELAGSINVVGDPGGSVPGDGKFDVAAGYEF